MGDSTGNLEETFPDIAALIPLHFHRPPDPSRRQAVIGGLDLHATVQMNDAFSVLVIAGGFQR
jgi:hypothetical protein